MKYDGERITAHKFSDNRYMFFTRGAHGYDFFSYYFLNFNLYSYAGCDYTAQLGSDSSSQFAARIHPFFNPEIKECVLDGELLVWDKNLESFGIDLIRSEKYLHMRFSWKNPEGIRWRYI